MFDFVCVSGQRTNEILLDFAFFWRNKTVQMLNFAYARNVLSVAFNSFRFPIKRINIELMFLRQYFFEKIDEDLSGNLVVFFFCVHITHFCAEPFICNIQSQFYRLSTFAVRLHRCIKTICNTDRSSYCNRELLREKHPR